MVEHLETPVPPGASGRPLTVDDDYEPFVIEQRGIDIVPAEERKATPSDLFWMWLGTTVNVTYLIYGALAVIIGLTFLQATIAILIGNLLAYVLLGLSSLQGPQAGTTSFTISRAAFGYNANRGVGFFNWITLVGYETLELAVIVLAALALFSKAGISDSVPLKATVIIAAALIQLPLPLYGHATVLKSLKYLSYVFVIFSVLMAILVLPKVNLSAISQGGSFAAFTLVVALVMVTGGLGWSPLGNDYSRYVPAATSSRNTFLGVALGGFIPSLLLEIVGAAVASIAANASDVVAGFPQALPTWFVVPFLVLAIIELFAINTIDLYSSGLSLQAIGLKIKRWQAVCVDLVICTIALYFVIFSNAFNTILTNFLSLSIIWIAPWVGIFLVDWRLRRGTYNSAALIQRHRGVYWRNGGFHIPAVIAELVGMVLASLSVNLSFFAGPLSKAAGGTDFSVFIGLLAGGLIYFVLARRSVASELSSGSD